MGSSGKDNKGLTSKMGKTREQERIEKQRGTIERLKKEVSKLRKAVKKQVGTIAPVEEFIDFPEEIKQEDTSGKCPECKGTNIGTLDLGSKVYYVCKDCKWRKSIEAPPTKE